MMKPYGERIPRGDLDYLTEQHHRAVREQRAPVWSPYPEPRQGVPLPPGSS